MKLLIIFAISAILLQYHFAASAPSGEGSDSKIKFAIQSGLPQYKIEGKIGEGAFGMVFSAIHLLTDKEVAVKAIYKSNMTEKELFEEPDNMEGLDHPNIVKLFQVINTDEYLCLVMEKVSGGDALKYLNVHQKMPEEVARFYISQIAHAVRYLHQNEIVHRDLKINNLLLDSSKQSIKIADFGSSTKFTTGSKLEPFRRHKYYTAPEIILKEKYDGPKADVWSLGINLHLMLTFLYPFFGGTFNEVLADIRKGYNAPSEAKECKNLLQNILKMDPIERYSVEKIIGDPWIKPYVGPTPDSSNEERITKDLEKHYKIDVIKQAIAKADYHDNVFAAFLILGGNYPKAHKLGSSGDSNQHGSVAENSNVSKKRPSSSGNSPPTKKQQFPLH